jgi:hypothetical protein
MSHEIRTPLNAILDLAHLLRRPTRFSALHERIGKPVDPEALFSTLLKWLPDEDALLDAVSSPVAAAPAVIGWPSAQAVVVRLEALLAKDDIQTNEVFLEATPALRTASGEMVRILGRQINGFAYPQALETPRGMVAEHLELRGDPTG